MGCNTLSLGEDFASLFGDLAVTPTLGSPWTSHGVSVLPRPPRGPEGHAPSGAPCLLLVPLALSPPLTHGPSRVCPEERLGRPFSRRSLRVDEVSWGTGSPPGPPGSPPLHARLPWASDEVTVRPPAVGPLVHMSPELSLRFGAEPVF